MKKAKPSTSHRVGVHMKSALLVTLVITSSLFVILYFLGDKLHYQASLANFWDGRDNCNTEGCARGGWTAGGLVANPQTPPPENQDSRARRVGSPPNPWVNSPTKTAPTGTIRVASPFDKDSPDARPLPKGTPTTLIWSCSSSARSAKVVNSSGTTVSTATSATAFQIGPFNTAPSGSVKSYKLYCDTETTAKTTIPPVDEAQLTIQ